ncbi:MAG TPA: ATP-binding protein, partial [Usitatibacter sp.]|nr:ATP-binding protein [Usitatibacter sp.]
TRQRRMIEALRHSEEASDARAKELAAVLEATPAAIWIAHDVDCKVVTGSRAGRAMLRAAPLENLSKSSDEAGRLAHFKVLRHGRELAPEELPLQRAARGETIRDFEEEIVFETGERRHLLGDAVPMHDAQGRLRGAVAAFIDVTRLRETTVELREGAKRKDEFLALLGHELRSPLSAIQSSAHLLAGMTGGNDHLARVAGIVRRQSEQLARLVDDLLDVSRITHGKIAIHKEDIPLRAIVDRAVEASRHLIDSGAHALEIRVDDESLRVQGDLARLSQVVCNLLNNAARYTPRGGHIRLEAQRRGEWIRVAVADDGIGLAPEALERIFQLFEQAHEVRSRSMGGLGVGLALARALVELHGGRITARSDGLGRGSEFEVLLPVS